MVPLASRIRLLALERRREHAAGTRRSILLHLPRKLTRSFHQSFEQLNPRAVAVVIDPIQSVKGKVVIDAFRSINPQSVMMGLEPRQSTSNVGHLGQPSIQVRSRRWRAGRESWELTRSWRR